MFNSGPKKHALAVLQCTGKQYGVKQKELIDNAEILHKKRVESRDVLKEFCRYVQAVKHQPFDIQKKIGSIETSVHDFDSEIKDIIRKNENIDTSTKKTVGGGAITGVGIAAFGPTTAMAIATTFGTASTGAAIGTLSGAAATNAALAWLGGGALAAGGGGMAAGNTFLAIAGPAGWAIGGLAIIGGSLMTNSRNKKITKEAEKKIVDIKSQITEIEKLIIKIKELDTKISDELKSGIHDMLSDFISRNMYDHRQFSPADRDKFMSMMNTANALSNFIGKKIA